LFDAAREFPSYRLPELFGGQPRSEFQPPVPYPVACRPQAWTAGCLLHLVQAMLGLQPDPQKRRLNLIRPHLPYWLRQVNLRGVPFMGAEIDLAFHREHGETQVDFDVRGNVEVRVQHDWRAFVNSNGED
jgi:glycogen debranching enzyme